MSAKDYKVTEPCHAAGRPRAVGEVVRLTDSQAVYLLLSGRIRPLARKGRGK